MPDIATSQLLTLAAAAIGTGLLAGFLAGLFGIGGGAIMVPVFYQALTLADVPEAVRMHIAVGTSLAIIVPTSIRSYLSHRKRGEVDHDLLRSFVIAVPAGALFASLVSAFISGEGLRAMFALIAVLIGIKLLLGRQDWNLGSTIPGQPWRSLVGFTIGTLSAWMGIGGGVLNNTFMTLYGTSMRSAVATSSAVGVLIAVPGLIGFIVAGLGAEGLPPFSIGFVNLIALGVIIPVTLSIVPLGVAAAHQLNDRAMQIAFGLFMFAVSARFVSTLL